MNSASGKCGILSILLIVGIIVEADAIKCFQCSSIAQSACVDIEANDTSSPFLHTCPPQENHTLFCRKIVQTIMGKEKEVRVWRGCGSKSNDNKTSCRKTHNDFKQERICKCYEDSCNTANEIHYAKVLFVLIAGTLGIFI